MIWKQFIFNGGAAGCNSPYPSFQVYNEFWSSSAQADALEIPKSDAPSIDLYIDDSTNTSAMAYLSWSSS